MNASRKKRIAAGSGTTVQEVNRLLKQFEQSRQLMKRFAGMGRKKIRQAQRLLRLLMQENVFRSASNNKITKQRAYARWIFNKDFLFNLEELSCLKSGFAEWAQRKAPFYRIVVQSRAPRDGAFVEEIGYYNPLTDPEQVVVDGDKAKQWIKNGAQPTETVRGLFKKHGVID